MTIYGRKIGMTRWIDQENGAVHAITVLQCEPNRVVRKMTNEKNGYESVQVSFGKAKRLTKPKLGVYKALDMQPHKYLREIAVNDKNSGLEAGSEIKVSDFSTGELVDITGVTIGKGFAGCVKRHNFKTQDATHGNSLSHRAPGSIGQCQDPGRVFKGKKMAGRMGGVQRTAKNLEVMHVDLDKNLILVKGAVPGHKQGLIMIQSAKNKKQD